MYCLKPENVICACSFQTHRGTDAFNMQFPLFSKQMDTKSKIAIVYASER